MKTALTTFVWLFLVGFARMADAQSTNAFFIGDQQLLLNSCIVANESFGTQAKYDLSVRSANGSFVAFSATSATTYKMSDGLYTFSELSPATRTPGGFAGSVKLGNTEIRIRRGTFAFVSLVKTVRISFVLELQNGDVVTGMYEGPAKLENRSTSYTKL